MVGGLGSDHYEQLTLTKFNLKYARLVLQTLARYKDYDLVMNEESVFHLISNIIHKEGVSCVLIGGFAVNHYKVTRQTADVDFLITREDFDRILSFLENAGYKKFWIQDTFIQLKSNQLSLLDIDFMFVDKQTLEKVINDAQKLEIAGRKFIVPSLNHLIALKLHSIKYNPGIRLNKDLPDIINLIRINEVDVEEENFKKLCLKYGSQEIYEKILEMTNG